MGLPQSVDADTGEIQEHDFAGKNCSREPDDRLTMAPFLNCEGAPEGGGEGDDAGSGDIELEDPAATVPSANAAIFVRAMVQSTAPAGKSPPNPAIVGKSIRCAR